jgi:hypothetical protein
MIDDDKVISIFSVTGSRLRRLDSHVARSTLARERQILAIRCFGLFNLFHDLTGDNQRDIGKDLLVQATLFFQTDNVLLGRPSADGIQDHPFLVTLRKVLVTEGMVTIPPLPNRVLESLH